MRLYEKVLIKYVALCLEILQVCMRISGGKFMNY